MIMRVFTGVEFIAALALWAMGLIPWPIAGAVATVALIGFMCTWDDGARSATPWQCRWLGCDTPDRGPCHRCGQW